MIVRTHSSRLRRALRVDCVPRAALCVTSRRELCGRRMPPAHLNMLPLSPWFRVHYRTSSREGLSICRICGCRIVGIFDGPSKLLTITLSHIQQCSPADVVGLVTIDGERRAAAILSQPPRMVIPAARTPPFGTAYDRISPIRQGWSGGEVGVEISDLTLVSRHGERHRR